MWKKQAGDEGSVVYIWTQTGDRFAKGSWVALMGELREISRQAT